jgi:tRNA-splicing ligase RtcB
MGKPFVMNKGKVPVKIWSPIEQVESAALDQLTNISNLPCVFKHVAVMPDVHLGKGATVGSVVATTGAIIPAAVGVDIGCGMMAVKLPVKSNALPDSLKAVRSAIEQSIPVGFNEHKEAVQPWCGFEFERFGRLPGKVQGLFGKAQRQLGTLGGGNHFIELCLDTEDYVWVMLHSGSRNIGKEIAEVHINEAKDLMKQYFIGLPDPDLAYLVEGSIEFDLYWRDLQWAQEYAMVNRSTMSNRILKIVEKVLGLDESWLPLMTVNCHHNYAEREHHYGHNVIVTRKGAVRARVGDFGIIPGSMGTRSYIVEGLGNEDSFCSCSHGAGRRMSRGRAKSSFSLAELEAQTAGVECRKDAGILDEIPGAYKDIDQVMENQKDLVKIVATLKQILCVKG